MSSGSNNSGQRNRHSIGEETQTEVDEDNQETEGSQPILTRRSTLIGTAVGLTLLSGTSQSAGAQPGQRWQTDVDANGNDLRNLGGLNMDVMAQDELIADFEGTNLEITDAALNLTDQLDVDTVDASDVGASDLVRTPQLTGGVTDGERLQQLAGDNLTITDNRLDAISRWRKRDVLLEPSDEDVDGIEVEDVESPESGDLNVEADGDLTLSISGGDGAIRIETDGGHRVVVDDGSESISVEDSAGNSVEMDSDTGELSVSAAEKLTLDAPTIELSAGVDLNVRSHGDIDIRSDGNTELVSSGITDIDGAVVELGGGGSPAASTGDLVEDGKIKTGNTSVLL